MANGLFVGGEQLFLAAWEVMPLGDWAINNNRAKWNSPSIDFLALDRAGHLMAVELKREVRLLRACWSVLFQVTHRAEEIAQTFTPERLQGAYTACWLSTSSAARAASPDLWEAHAQFFALDAPVARPNGAKVRRVVAAAQFGPAFQSVLYEFSSGDRAELLLTLRERWPREREFGRSRSGSSTAGLQGEVVAVLVDEMFEREHTLCENCGLRAMRHPPDAGCLLCPRPDGSGAEPVITESSRAGAP